VLPFRSLLAACLCAAPLTLALEAAPFRFARPVQNFLFDVTYAPTINPSAFLAVGEASTSAVLHLGWRLDAGTGIWAPAWELPSLGLAEPAHMRGIATSGTKYIAVGNSSTYQPDPTKEFPRISISDDGRTWTTKAGNATGYLSDVSYGGGTWVASGYTILGTSSRRGQIQYSKDDGATWNAIVLGENEHMMRASFDGSQWVAVGEKREGAVGGAILETRVYTSPDGVKWTLRTSPGAVTLNDIASSHGVWVAVGIAYPHRGTPQPIILRSPDGIAWTDVSFTFPETGGELTAVAPTYKGFVAVGNGTLLYSKDGAAWSILTESFAGHPVAIASQNWENQGALLAIVGDTGAVWIDTVTEWESTVGLASVRRASSWRLDGSTLQIPSDVRGPFEVTLRAPSGVIVATLHTKPNAGSLPLPRLRGLHLVEIRTGDGRRERLRLVTP
jgi:hypothetical protein